MTMDKKPQPTPIVIDRIDRTGMESSRCPDWSKVLLLPPVLSACTPVIVAIVVHPVIIAVAVGSAIVRIPVIPAAQHTLV